MNKRLQEKLEQELSIAGVQLMSDNGIRWTNKAQATLSQWARVQAEILSRRLRL